MGLFNNNQNFGPPLATCIVLLLLAPGVVGLPNLRYTNTSKQAAALEAPIIAVWASPDKQVEVLAMFTDACIVCEQAVRIPTFEGGDLRCDTPKVPDIQNPLPDIQNPLPDIQNPLPDIQNPLPKGLPKGPIMRLDFGSPKLDPPCSASAPSVKMDEVSMCEAATKYPDIVAPGLPKGKVSEAIDTSQRMCPCFKELPAYLSEFSVADFRTAAAAGAGKLADCLTTRGLDIKDNMAEVEGSGPLSEAKGDKIIRAPEVGMALYMSLSASGAACASGVGSSECTTVVSLLLKYFKDAASSVGGGLADWLEQYVVGGAIASVVGPLEQAARGADPVAALQTQLQACAAAAKGDAGVTSAQAAVAELQEAVAGLSKQLEDAKALQQSMTTAVRAVRAMADAAGKSYEQHLVTAVQGLLTGDLSGTFVDLVSFMGTSDDVTRVLTDAQTFAGNMQKLQGDIDAMQPAVTKAQQALTGLKQEEASSIWEMLFPGGGGGGGACPVDGGASLAAIQAPLQTARGAAVAAQGRLAQLDPRDLQMDVATINRHFEVSADLPCTTTGSVKVGPQSFDVPQFYICRAEATVPMPNEFIPFIRIKGGNAA